MWIYFWNIFFFKLTTFSGKHIGQRQCQFARSISILFKKHDACTLCWTTWFCNYSQHGHSHPCFFCQKPDFGHWQVAMKATCVSCGTMAISFPTASWFTAQSSCHSIIGRHDQNFHKGGNPIQGGKASDDPRWPDSPLWRKAIPTTQANLSPHHPISVWPHCGNECQLVPVQPSLGADHHKESKFQEPNRESRRSIKFQWPRKPRSWGPFWKPRKCQAPPKKGDSIHAWKQPAMVGDYYSQGPWCPVLAVRQKTNQRWLVHRDGARIHCSGGRTFERSIQDGFADGNQVDQEGQDCTIGELFAIAVFAYEKRKVHQQPSMWCLFNVKWI